DESLADVAKELQRAEAQTGREQLDAEGLHQKTTELSAAVDRARREREAAQEALTAALLHAQEAAHTCERLRQDSHRLQADGENGRKELQALLAKREKALADVQAARSEREAAAEAVALAETAVTRAKAHVEGCEDRREQAQKALKDVQNEIEAGHTLSEQVGDRLHRQEMNLTRVKGDLSVLNDRLWDTYALTYAGARDAHAEYVLLRNRAAAQEAAQDSDNPTAPPEATAEETAAAAATPPALPDGLDEAEADRRAQEIRERIRHMGNVNVNAIEEFTQLHARATALAAQRDDLLHARDDLQSLIRNLLEHMRTVFVGQFGLLQGYFEETFARLFGGGHGEIRLSDPEDPLNCGIEIIVQPPGKKRQLLSLFSGGERALTAIAILFAMLKLKPTPFCILDEIEAALDEANIGYFADYLKEFSLGTQFVVVTHRKGTMERCDALFGVAMEERGVSSMVSVCLKDYD
ncbi:MAG: hypothetical protein VB104_11460, partial [Candidatus Limiplasma sp.]|nr:hypothetical protein [Candidatus Limiplasma sp.]